MLRQLYAQCCTLIV